MTIIRDPEGNERAVLHGMVDFGGKSVLEIGCGDGEFTWKFAHLARRVVGIDPIGEEIQLARANIPKNLAGRVQFVDISLEDFARSNNSEQFDIAIFSWSL